MTYIAPVRIVVAGLDTSGPVRPTNAPQGFVFFDETLNVAVVWDDVNSVWRDYAGRDTTPGLYDLVNAGIPTNGPSGTGNGVAAPGCLLIDTTNKRTYQNVGTKASPTWTLVGTESAAY